jgi:hypothetical protein
LRESRDWTARGDLLENGYRVSDRIGQFKRAVEKACGCKVKHNRSGAVVEGFEGEQVWDGVIEVFDLDSHPKAKQCYAFLFAEDGTTVIKIVLGVPPVESELDAVRMAIAGKALEK